MEQAGPLTRAHVKRKLDLSPTGARRHPSIGLRPVEAAPSRRSQSHGSKHPNQFRHRLTRRGLPVLVALAPRAHDEPAAPMTGGPTPPTRTPQVVGETER